MSRKTIPSSLKKELSNLMESVNSRYGNALTFVEGTSARWPDDKIIRTGSLGLDMAIGIGGWPLGRIIELYGEYSSGKTTLALHSVREAQRAGYPVVYVDAENALDPNYARKLGVDLKSMLISQPSSQEQAIDLMNTIMCSDHHIGLIVVDSVPALQPQAVMESSAEQETMAAAARKWSGQLPGLSYEAARTGTTILLLNQTRSSMNPYGSPTTTSGGKALQFFTSLRVFIKRYVEGKNNDGASYQKCNLDVVKNKVGSPFKKTVFDIIPGEAIDWSEDVVFQALERGIAQDDTKYDDDGSFIQKKGWKALPLHTGDVELIQQDDPTFPDGYSGVTFTDNYIQAYQNKRFYGALCNLPTLLETIEERVLNSLNDGMTAIESDSGSELESIQTEAERIQHENQYGEEEQDIETENEGTY